MQRWKQVNDLPCLIEEFDPDWQDHFLDYESAAEFYQDEPEFIALVEEFLDEENDDE